MDNLTEWQEFTIAVCELNDKQKKEFLQHYASIVDGDPTMDDYKACKVALDQMGLRKLRCPGIRK